MKSKQDDLKRITDFISNIERSFNNDDVGEHLVLGERWDDPASIFKALDRHAAIYAYWASVQQRLIDKRQVVLDKYSVFLSLLRIAIEQKIFVMNTEKGVTPNQSKPSQRQIDDYLNKYVIDVFAEHREFRKERLRNKKFKSVIEKYNKRINDSKIIVDALKQRKDLLGNFSLLLKTMIDNRILELKVKGKDSDSQKGKSRI